MLWAIRSGTHVALLNASSVLTLAHPRPAGLQAAFPSEYRGRGLEVI